MDNCALQPRVVIKPCIRGTRVTIEHVLRKLGEGLTVEQVLATCYSAPMPTRSTRLSFASLSLVIGALLIACSGQPEATSMATAEPTSKIPQNLTNAEVTMSHKGFSQGPALVPTDALLTWLETRAGTRILRLPVIVTASPLGVTSAFIGAHTGADPATMIELQLDQGALGVALHERLPVACQGGPCAVWLEGSWGSLVSVAATRSGPAGPSLDGSATSEASDRRHFTVRDLIGPVEGAATHILIADQGTGLVPAPSGSR